MKVELLGSVQHLETTNMKELFNCYSSGLEGVQFVSQA
jgi:hypothetical protein